MEQRRAFSSHSRQQCNIGASNNAATPSGTRPEVDLAGNTCGDDPYSYIVSVEAY